MNLPLPMACISKLKQTHFLIMKDRQILLPQLITLYHSHQIFNLKQSNKIHKRRKIKQPFSVSHAFAYVTHSFIIKYTYNIGIIIPILKVNNLNLTLVKFASEEHPIIITAF